MISQRIRPVEIVGSVLGVRTGSVVLMWSEQAVRDGGPAPALEPLYDTAVSAMRHLVSARAEVGAA